MLNPPVERVLDGTTLIAMIMRREDSAPGVHFLTPPTYPLQLGQMAYGQGHVIKPHQHNAVRECTSIGTQEVLLVRRGKMRISLYSQSSVYLSSHDLSEGDLIFLVCGGHGVEVTEDLDMIEIKQGPFLGACEKVPI